jgi:hypothetical protein
MVKLFLALVIGLIILVVVGYIGIFILAAAVDGVKRKD